MKAEKKPVTEQRDLYERERTARQTPSAQALSDSWERLRTFAPYGKDSEEFRLALDLHCQICGGRAKDTRERVLQILRLNNG